MDEHTGFARVMASGADTWNANLALNPYGGNVGIGTTSPLAALSVGSGSLSDTNVPIQISAPSSGAGFIGVNKYGAYGLLVGYVTNGSLSGNGAYIRQITTDPLFFNVNNTTTAMTILSSGNVGIGTSAPAYKLDVAGLIRSSSGGIMFPDGSVQTTATGQTLSANNQIVQSNGNVGIGTTGPQGQLNIGNVSNAGLKTYTNGQGDGLIVNAYYNSSNIYESYVDLVAARTSSAINGGSNFRFLTQPLSSGNPAVAMVINQSGNVGIGTATPTRKLHIAGDVQIDGNLYFGSTPIPQNVPYAGSACQGGDYAESVDVAGDRMSYEPGDVLVIDPDSEGEFLKSVQPYSTFVTGIYSTKPGVIGRRQTSDISHAKDEVPMAMVGIVPTKVSAENGPIKAGDLLVTSSTLGYAMKGTDRSQMLGAVIGKALGHLDSGTGVIEVVVTLQ